MPSIYRSNIVEIDLNAIAHNVRVLKDIVRPARVMAVVKADAYGHGIMQSARAALEAGADSLGVAIPEEGVLLRESGFDCPILVMGGTSRAGCEASVEYNLTQTVFSEETAKYLHEATQHTGLPANIHIKLDTGMNRVGIKTERELKSLMELIKDCPLLSVSAAFTHFACADEDEAATRSQNERFSQMLDCLRKLGFGGYLHAANSAAALRFKWTHYDCVRPGLAIYGADPMAGTDTGGDYSLIPAMTWRTRVAQVKLIGEGERVSYGWRFTAPRAMPVATLMVGYGDGYKRLNGAREDGTARGHVLINGRRAPIIGRVCMDQMMVDLTGIQDVKAGDWAVLLGGQGSEFISVDELSSWADTISYETLLSVSPRVPRLYVRL